MPGSEKKRRFVRRFGVKHVFNSRTLDFKTEIIQVTGGKGVDMVLNCLTGPGFKESSLDVCRDGGHFVEISKLDIWAVAEVEDRRPQVKYSIVDLTRVENSVIYPILVKLSTLLSQGYFRPLQHITFSANYITQALSYLQKAKHIGKIVINMPVSQEGRRKTQIFNERSTYLITAGKTGIGFEVCKWMVKEQGAKYVVLASRSPAKENVKQKIMDLKDKFGSIIVCKEVDVSDYGQCKTLIEHDLKNMPPLKGVHHCAAILSDQLISKQDWSNFERVISPKAGGAWNLHKLTLEIPLEHFVLYSSAISVFGNVGQTNYACANSYLDSLAVLRASMGLPVLSINWGQWKAGLAENVNVPALRPFSIKDGIRALEYFMENYHEQKNQIVAATIYFDGLLKLSANFKSTLVEDIVMTLSTCQNKSFQSEAISTTKIARVGLTAQLRQCDNEQSLEQVINDFIWELLCDILGTAKEEIKNDVRFTDMGMDSLMSIEFTNKIESAFQERESEGKDDVQRESIIQLDLDENGTLQKLTSFLLEIWKNIMMLPLQMS